MCWLTGVVWVVRADADARATDIILDHAFLQGPVNRAFSNRAPAVMVSD